MTSSPPPPSSERKTSRTEAQLREAGHELRCATVGLLSSTGAVERVWARSRTALEFGQAQMDALGAEIVRACIERQTDVVSNRVRQKEGGPVIARLIALPVRTGKDAPKGVLVALWRPNDPGFKESAVAMLRTLAAKLAERREGTAAPNMGLLSWPSFCRRLERLTADAAPETPIAVLYGNIDQLHVFNKARGMTEGDGAIDYAALVIRRIACKVTHAACRLSGDRFVVALPTQSLATGRDIAENIRVTYEAETARRFGIDAKLTISWGVAETVVGQANFEHALAEAELACRAAKDRGRNRVETYAQSDASMIRRHDDIDALRLLRDAIDSDRLLIYAQPIMPLLNTALPTSYEFLVRISDRKGRIARPDEFLSAAARYQMLPALDRAALSTALAQLRAALPGEERLPFTFSVNFAAPTLVESGIEEWLIELLDRHHIPRNQFTVEVTESAAASNLEHMQRTIASLARSGVRFAIDDFGTGVNSLSHIKAFDIAAIKLDGSYVRDVLSDARSQALVRAIVQLADSMGIVTIAEFVDTVALRARLAELGVHFAQGYAVGRPEPLADLLDSLPRAQQQQIA